MKLTADLISRARTYINPLKEREIELRGKWCIIRMGISLCFCPYKALFCLFYGVVAGHKIPMVESLGATKDCYDCIDLSDNEIQKLENFPLLKRLTMLLVNNNRVTKVDSDIGKSLPNLDTMVLTNNYIASLSEIDALASFTKLTSLSLLHNPVTRRQHYRFYVVHKLPQLKELDFRKIKPEERAEAEKLFKTSAGKQLEQAISKVRYPKWCILVHIFKLFLM